MSPPAGLLFHAGIGEGADFFTVTVWESQAAYDAFAGTSRVAIVGHVNSQFLRVKVYDLAGNAVDNTCSLFGTC